MPENLAWNAFWFGIISAVSLPLGAMTILFWKPKDRVTAFLMAFGGGALLSALTIDLVGEALERGHFYSLALGCILGGIFFVILNQIINNRGGFLRKAATTIHFLKKEKIRRFKKVFNQLSQVNLFHELPPEEVQAIVPYVTSRNFKKGRTIFRQGEPGDSLFILETGEVEVVDVKNKMMKLATMSSNDVLGEISLLTGEAHSATAITLTDTKMWVILKEHFDRLLHQSPKLAESVKNLINNRTLERQQKQSIDPEKASEWVNKAVKHIDEKMAIPTETDIREAVTKHGGAPLAIWLGIFLDGIPESLVIGSSMLHASISFSLIAGLFLSNYPEALSSSAGMRHQGYSISKILWMWTSLMIVTGIGAFLGNIFFREIPLEIFSLVEGMAAGAMLTMIAETMLPEAYYKGGTITGFSTLLGFLAAIFFKTLE